METTRFRTTVDVNVQRTTCERVTARHVKSEVRERPSQNGFGLFEERRPLLPQPGWSPSLTARPLRELSPVTQEPRENRARLQCQRSVHLRQDYVYKFGEPGSGLRVKGAVQDFYKLREECLEKGKLFEDPQFPAEDSSIFFNRNPAKPIKWMRPQELVALPRLFVDGASRFDVKQGELGDCWFLAAVATLTLNDHFFSRVIPHDQGFSNKYAGIFHFRFWQYGRWVDVVIDDRLPTYGGKLIYLHSSSYNEFWSSLLEKAYAKLYGSYNALSSGVTAEAMEDFTGGVTEMYELNNAPPNMYNIILKACQRGSMMGCSIEADPDTYEARTTDGLIRGHAYSITEVKYVNIATPRKTGKIPLLRLRNPWGNECEWNGPWSDKSQEWKFIPDSEKENIGLTFKADGEFWMSFTDFKRQFSRIEICNLSPDTWTEENVKDSSRKWEMSMFEGKWVIGVTAGGCRNYIDTFAHNPQYRITLEDPDEEDDDDKCTVIIALMQKNGRLRRKSGSDFLTIGFAVYHLPNPDSLPKPLGSDFFKRNKSAAMSPQFINLREVTSRFKLAPGTYCIIPSTFEPSVEGEFILRVFSEHKNNLEENDEKVAMCEVTDDVKMEVEQDKEDKMKDFYSNLAGDDMEVDWMELKQLLDYAMSNEKQEFSKDTCRSMIAMKDADKSGKLGYEEFISLWKDIRLWRHVFKSHERVGTGTLNGFELREALRGVGYRLNSHTLNVLMHRYGTKDGKITFDDFMLCAIKLKTMIDTFYKRDPGGTQNATFTIEEWIEITLYS